jgi:orotate phosphoribosyltransferase-like protein
VPTAPATDWLCSALGARLETDPGQSSTELGAMVGIALRRNPRRPHLLVSRVLGKHIPVDPRIVLDSGSRLGAAAGAVLDEAPGLVIGFAETATGLGHAVAAALGADYLHSTRRRVDGVATAGGFEEEHSHATGHLLLPEDAAWLTRPGPVVLVDDEFSTGSTAMNTIAALQALRPRAQYVLAAHVDVRPPDERERLARFAADLGTEIVVVAAARGRVWLPPDLVQAAKLAGRPAAAHDAPAGVRALRCGWPIGVREGGRHGFATGDQRPAEQAAARVAADVAGVLVADRILVLGTEELMYAPTLIAAQLAGRCGDGATVSTSSTTRSPVVAIDEPGYPIRNGLTFAAHDDPEEGTLTRFAYNVAPIGDAPGFSDVVVIVDGAGDAAALWARDGLVAAVAPHCRRVTVVVLPTYRPPPG